jgi:hypothetical protein
MKLNNIQSIRKKLISNRHIFDLLYENSKILVWNFWYIIIPNNKNKPVSKLYIKKEYFEKELNNYILLSKNHILVPSFDSIWQVKISNLEFHKIEFANIRTFPKFKILTDISPKKLWNLLSMIHIINSMDWKYCLHWNLHESNFYEDKDRNLWIFDLTSMFYWEIEYDFASIYVNTLCDDKYISEVLKSYKFNNIFDYNKMYENSLIMLMNFYALWSPVRNENTEWLENNIKKLSVRISKNKSIIIH